MLKNKFKVITNKNYVPNNFNIAFNKTIKPDKTIKSTKALKKKKTLTDKIAANKKIDYPVFSYTKLTRILQKKLNNMNLILNHMDNLHENIESIGKQIQSCGTKLNLFINNTFKIKPKFNYNKHFIIIKDNILEFHDLVDLDTALVQNEILMLHYEDTEEIMQLVPKNKKRINANETQIRTCNNLYNAFIVQNENFNYLTENFDSATELYNYLIDSVKEEFNKVNITNITGDEVDLYSEISHDIIWAQDNDELNVFYVRKEDKDKFLQLLSKILKK